ncbi:hypothetical protein [Priestia megaterium]|uniref:hypothetical protein n=1 Tax=Priestia megaterium TaxID=1404 RepID=UPI00203E3F8D|nr:hypothetical protein [Priestia megaterium]MCM3186798.1 hypothetical protein [Priestia megaterium]
MYKLVLKHYFLKEIERIQIEDEILKKIKEDEYVLHLDDYEIIDLYKKNVKKEQLCFTID